MSRILLYGPLAIILALGAWLYYQGDAVPDTLAPVIAILLAVMTFGYAIKAQDDGDIGAGTSKIRREKNPRVFQIALYVNYFIVAVFVGAALYLFGRYFS